MDEVRSLNHRFWNTHFWKSKKSPSNRHRENHNKSTIKNWKCNLYNGHERKCAHIHVHKYSKIKFVVVNYNQPFLEILLIASRMTDFMDDEPLIKTEDTVNIEQNQQRAEDILAEVDSLLAANDLIIQDTDKLYEDISTEEQYGQVHGQIYTLYSNLLKVTLNCDLDWCKKLMRLIQVESLYAQLHQIQLYWELVCANWDLRKEEKISKEAIERHWCNINLLS